MRSNYCRVLIMFAALGAVCVANAQEGFIKADSWLTMLVTGLLK
jgi:hypothetical protein